MTKPKDLTWQELVLILKFCGYKELSPRKTGGSRIKFADEQKHIITLHRPYPNPIVKRYVPRTTHHYSKRKWKDQK